MDFFPIPESAAKLAAADKMVGAMMDLVSAIDERIQEHIGAVAQYTSATVNGVSGAVNKQIKSQTAKVLKAADKIQSRVEDTANTAQAMLQEHTAAVTSATSGGSDSVGVDAMPHIIGINPGGGCGIESFPLHLMSPDIAGGGWYYVAGAGGQWIAYGFVPPDFNASCWTVIGPFPEAPAAEAQFPNVPLFDPQQAPQPVGMVPIPGGQIAVPPGFSPTPISTPVGGTLPPHAPPFPPGVSPQLPPAIPPAPPAVPPSTIPIAPPVGPGQPGQPPAPPYYPPGYTGPRLPPGVTGSPPAGLTPPGAPTTVAPGSPGAESPPFQGGFPAPAPVGIVPPASFSPVLVGYMPTPLQVAGNGVVTVYTPLYGPASGPPGSVPGAPLGGAGPPSTSAPPAGPGGVGGAGGSESDASTGAGLAPYLSVPAGGTVGAPAAPAPCAPSLSCPPPVINVACGGGADAAAAAAAEVPLPPSRTIAVAGFEAEVADELMGGCKPIGVLLLPFPGDPKFCDKMVPIVNFLRNVGSLVLGPVPAVFDVEDEADDAMSWVKRAINFIVKWGGVVVKNVVKIWWGSQKGLRNCDWCALLGLDILRWIISFLRSVHIGVSVLVKLEFVLGIDDHRVDSLLRTIENYICPDRPITMGETVRTILNGVCWDDERERCALLIQGADPVRYEPILAAAGKHLNAKQHIMAGRLEGLTAEQVGKRLFCYGWRNPTDRANLLELYDRPPLPREALAWASNAITLPEFVKDYTLDQEFYARMWTPYKGELRAQGITEEVARAQWSHAQRLPSEGRLREALARLRPGRVKDEQAFTPKDYERHLAAEGVPPYWRSREWLMTGKVMAPGQVANLLYWAVFDTKEAEERLKDAGYTAVDSGKLLKAMIYDGRHRNATQIGGWTMPLLAHYRAIGAISAKAWEDKYSHLGYAEQDAAEGLEVAQVKAIAHGPEHAVALAGVEPIQAIIEGLRGGMQTGIQAAANLASFGVPIPAANAIVGAELYRAGVRRAKQAELFLRRAFIRGRLALPDAQKRMLALGFNAEYVAAVLPLWQVDVTTGPKMLTEGGVIAAYKNAVIDRQTAMGRLVNLGWRPADAEVRLATVDAGLEPKPLKGRRKRPPAEPGSAVLAKGDVKSLYIDGVIGDAIAGHILNALGYDSGAVDLLISDWDLAREKKAGKAEGESQQEPAPQG